MNYLHDERRYSISGAMTEARSVIVCALNYNAPLPYSTQVFAKGNQDAAPENPSATPRAWISRYAWGDDYHDVLKPKLDELVSWLRAELRQDFQSRAYVDTGPVLERLAAKHAGLGWLAKNTCLINQQLGSWLFLGVILTDLDLAPTLAEGHSPPRDLCGTCTRCIDACPTEAIVAPYVLDARRCIAYLTIELRGAIPEEFRPAMGSMVFGCDICQDVCPWNRKSSRTPLAEFHPRNISANHSAYANDGASTPESDALFLPALEWLVSLTEDEFRGAFRGSPVKRTKWRGLLRNACVALGNSHLAPEDPAYPRIVQRLRELAASDDAILAEHAAWALARLQSGENSSRSVTAPGASVVSAGHNRLTNHAEGK
jgi:epoxyqueuosine reductase